LTVAAATTSTSGRPTASSFVIVVGRSNTGPYRHRACRSVETVCGTRPASSSASKTANANPPAPWPRSNRTPAEYASRRAALALPAPSSSPAAVELAQWVSTSPGRSNGSTSATSGGPAAMCAITGTPADSAAATARRNGSTPPRPTVVVSTRTLTPTTRSRLAVIVAAARSGSQAARSRLSPVAPVSPTAEMWRKQWVRTA
jgi:hypothetical protein